MRLAHLARVALSLMLLGAPSAARAQRSIISPAPGYASVVLDPGYEGEDYSASVVQVLKDKYQLKLTGATERPRFEWVALDPMPLGLTVDSATGQIFGTLARSRPQPYRFRLHVLDRSVPNPSPLKLQLSLKVARGPRPGKAPTLEPISAPTEAAAPAHEENGAGNGAGGGTGGHQEAGPGRAAAGGGDVEIHAVEPKPRTTLAMTIKNPSIRQVEVLAKTKDGKLIDRALTPADLARGEAQTFVTVKLEEGDNTLEVRNADTGELYGTVAAALGQAGGAATKQKGADKSPPPPEIVHSGFVTGEVKATPIKIKVEDQEISSVRIKVQSKTGDAVADLPGQPEPLKLNRGQNEYVVVIPLADPGSTLVTVSDAVNPKKTSKPLEIKRAEPSEVPRVEVWSSRLVNKEVTSAPLQIKVNDPKIRKLNVVVTPRDAKKLSEVAYWDVLDIGRAGEDILKVIGLPSDDEIKVRLYDVSDLPELKKDEIPSDTHLIPGGTLDITRRAGGSPASTIVTNSLNTRAIIGFEQAGASSADSKSEPFLDFFFTAPMRFKPKDDALPRVSTWGQVRLAAVPQQVSTFGTFATSFVSPLAENRLTQLVQGFDFMAGLEVRVFGTNKPYVSLIPGVKNQTFFNIVGGGGAISPLSARANREAAEILAVPAEGSPQRELFIERYGAAAAGKKYIALVFPERDRFLRQFYGGVRFKTFYYDDEGALINRFPAIFDIMVGQNEAVTGGRLQSDVTDEKGRLIGQKRRYVLRLEAFYPFPIREANFLYLYGTAMMKIGAGGVKIDTPLFLNRAPGEVSLTDNDVFIAPTLQTNRDYYRFGVGVNLTELFNRRPPTERR
ncbi:MAG: hypothetical protein M3416_08025 [Acidobacteriota bacterium]|nr:hypothetical protein [Acidobacteriota bacterium]